MNVPSPTVIWAGAGIMLTFLSPTSGDEQAINVIKLQRVNAHARVILFILILNL